MGPGFPSPAPHSVIRGMSLHGQLCGMRIFYSHADTRFQKASAHTLAVISPCNCWVISPVSVYLCVCVCVYPCPLTSLLAVWRIQSMVMKPTQRWANKCFACVNWELLVFLSVSLPSLRFPVSQPPQRAETLIWGTFLSEHLEKWSQRGSKKLEGSWIIWGGGDLSVARSLISKSGFSPKPLIALPWPKRQKT